MFTEAMNVFRVTLGIKVVRCRSADPESKGLVEGVNGYFETSLPPARGFTSPTDFSIQLAQWLATRANQRQHRGLGCRPADRWEADRAAMLEVAPVAPVVGGRSTTRPPRDHYVRVDSHDYSVHPAVVGRRGEIVAALDEVVVTPRGAEVAHHQRRWAEHQSITDPAPATAAAQLRQARHLVAVPAIDTDVEHRFPDRRRLPDRRRPRVRPGRQRERGDRLMATKTTSRNVSSELAYRTRALKAPSLAAAVERSTERARAESWSREEFLAASPRREVPARESHRGGGRIRGPRFPSRTSSEDFDFDQQRWLKREAITHLPTLDFIAAKENVVFLGPPNTGKTHLSIGIGIRARQAGPRATFATAAECGSPRHRLKDHDLDRVPAAKTNN